jgi:transglutaminase-like putative cysteine protease
MNRGHTVTHLVPRSDEGQMVQHSAVSVDPLPEERIEFDDAFGNHVVQFVVATPHDRLTVEAASVVLVDEPALPTDVTPWDAQVAWPPLVAGYCAASPYAAPTRAVRAFAEPCFAPGRPIADCARDLCRLIHAEFTFDPTFTDVATPLDEVLHARRGVCQDFAHLAVASLRAFGLPARYMSGYVETVPPPGEARMIGADASHAWCAVALGDGSWLALDPTNDQVPPLRHVVVAYGRDYLDVAPVNGVVIGPVSEQRLLVEVDVTSD